ncbi:MAG: dihydrodipicolinate synthase family protein [Clostridium luticellarii]|jgi:4-hydroxy-tetrahydrodipicolinate synthase|uniref:dihydrodipicolinate synthase family protein n=1 Tax=Clostridium luticellarii TaxID=1691940 RepID=UPI0023523A7A|nr:dihydrodipicolinate synthase family protein [Clostridium luticellarii]MCI1996219.1 dihydrodipicolinate synthase family protein [Clostridium luticellarii]MCI2040520.1 dihydrodipicolinate synthase family protein [Clostridium luticellarii]
MKKAKFLTPVITAFNADGSLDVRANKDVYDRLINSGIDGLVIMGSTGEFYAMSIEQRKELIDLVVTHVDKRAKVIIGTGCMTIEDTIELSNYAIDAGAENVIIVSPYYFSLTYESLEFYYGRISESVKGNIYLYNYPDRTGYDLSPEFTLNLLRKYNNIVGYKDTVSEMGHTRKLIQTVQGEFPEFEVFSGFDENFVHNILAGGSGCISALSNLYPEIFVKWVKAVNDKNMDRAAEIQNYVNKMSELYEISPCFIPILKKAMMIKGMHIKDYCKTPLLQADEKQSSAVEKFMEEVEHIIS